MPLEGRESIQGPHPHSPKVHPPWESLGCWWKAARVVSTSSQFCIRKMLT